MVKRRGCTGRGGEPLFPVSQGRDKVGSTPDLVPTLDCSDCRFVYMLIRCVFLILREKHCFVNDGEPVGF